METIKDILSEMRKDILRVVEPNVILRNYADRIERAYKNVSYESYMHGVREGVQDSAFKIRHNLTKFIGEYGIPKESSNGND